MNDNANSPENDIEQLPTLLAGPILRRVDSSQLTLWLVTSCEVELRVCLAQAKDKTQTAFEADSNVVSQGYTQHSFCVGTRAYIHLLHVNQGSLLHSGASYHYAVQRKTDSGWQDIVEGGSEALFYPKRNNLSFTYNATLTNVLHGSCRKPHFEGDDALVQVDNLIADSLDGESVAPDLLMMSGDQIYADDVAGPMLFAIRQLIERLGLHGEKLERAEIEHSEALDEISSGYYQREKILPKTKDNSVLSNLFFKAKRKPIFTSVNAKNHLIAFSEIIAMYILVWSPTPWRFISLKRPEHIPAEYHDLYDKERVAIESFKNNLSKTARAMAHLPVYMIFDDHDVSDDWNLTRSWEEAVYQHPLSKRMIGNALFGYWLCQGLGNNLSVFEPLIESVQDTLLSDAINKHDVFVESLLNWQDWHYCLPTSPPVYVMDTRTRRWRSESNPNKPSGLLDWEALCEFQQQIMGQKSVIVVSAAPIYGLKFIEAVQKVFTFFGLALMVDAENWMAHKGTAQVILNIFRHEKTPPKFIILSGDVHYSFVYDVSLRFRRNSPEILQFTCSGFKNAFPKGLLTWFERFNRALYSKRSPLNLFTRRRNMVIDERDPEPDDPSIVLGNLVNTPAVGQLKLAQDGDAIVCRTILANGKTIEFIKD